MLKNVKKLLRNNLNLVYIHLPTCGIATASARNSNTVMMCGKISCRQLFLLYCKSALGSTVVVGAKLYE